MPRPYLPVYLFTYELAVGDTLIGIGRVKGKRLLAAPGNIGGYVWHIALQPITGGLFDKPITLIALPNTEWRVRIA
jgi:hypothetical protein